MFKPLTNEEFLQKLKDMDIKYIPLEEYKGSDVKIKWMCHMNPNHIFETSPEAMYRCTKKGGCICPYCDRRIVFVGETDMWTTNPEMASLLRDKEEGYRYFATSSKKVDFICPRCGMLLPNKIINNVRMFGLCCPHCSDGMSFGEKFVVGLLVQLECSFVYNKTTPWSEDRRYDFYIPAFSLIIETHGIQHYKERSPRCFSDRVSRTLDEEIKNDEHKKRLALSNNIKYYIQLDCCKSNCDYIKNSILNSELNNLFDLSVIDWTKCYESTLTSNVVVCASLWNGGMKNAMEIAEYIGMDVSSVTPYLKRAAKIGLCDYVKNYKKNKNRYKKVLCIETGKVYEYIGEVEADGYNRFNISKCCNHRIKSAYGLHWKFI